MKVKVGDLVRHTNIPSWGAGLVVGRQTNSSGFFVQWLDPRRRICEKSLEVDLLLEVISGNK